MRSVASSVSIVSGGFLVFIILCSPILSVPIVFLLLYLLVLQCGFIWMVLTILKKGTPSEKTFDEQFYEDADKGPFA